MSEASGRIKDLEKSCAHDKRMEELEASLQASAISSPNATAEPPPSMQISDEVEKLEDYLASDLGSYQPVFPFTITNGQRLMSLPVTIAKTIFKCLDSEKGAMRRDLVKFRAVSKDWRDFVDSETNLWNDDQWDSWRRGGASLGMIRDLLLGAGPYSCDFSSVPFSALGQLSGGPHNCVYYSARNLEHS